MLARVFRDVISISGLNVDCVVGVYRHERDSLQPLSLDLELHLDTDAAALTERISRTVDYDMTCAAVVFLLKSCRFGLLEAAVHALARYLLTPPARDERRAALSGIKIRLRKPSALRTGAVAALEIERPASWAVPRIEERAYGRFESIFESHEAVISRVNVAPGQSWAFDVAPETQHAAMVLSDGLNFQGRAVAAGTVQALARGTVEPYENASERYQTVLCVTRPSALRAASVELVPPLSDVRSAYDL